jgi:hypothetical protein
MKEKIIRKPSEAYKDACATNLLMRNKIQLHWQKKMLKKIHLRTTKKG